MPRRSTTRRRKKEHVEIVLNKDVGHRRKSSGFDRYDFIHDALPELSLDDIDPRTSFLNRPLDLPLLITGMTGGYPGAVKINAGLAAVCQEKKIALGLGSQRQMLEDRTQWNSFRVARKKAPDIPLIGNIGATHVIDHEAADRVKQLAELIEADAIAVHLNALQEAVQPEGTADFRGVLRGIERVVATSPVPVIVKETGAGISADVAQRLIDAGVTIIDVSGAGGTSWSAVESFRKNNRKSRLAARFRDWGIPTADCVVQLARFREIFVIASGGIRDGVDIAKAIALGAALAGMARPLLHAFAAHGKKGLAAEIDAIRDELRLAMFLTGSASLTQLRQAPLVTDGR